MQAELTVESGPQVGGHYAIRLAQRFVLGRAQEVSIRLDDDKISRRHATLEMLPDGRLYVTDLGSRNGTFLQGVRLTPQIPAEVVSGDAIELGVHVLRVQLTGLDPRARRERARTQRLDEPVLPAEEFEILGEIGRGAGGCVYAARQSLMDRTVAVKVMRDEVRDDEARERFLREGRVSCRIHSPYVVQVFDIRSNRGRIYLVMELVNGPSLRDRLAGEPLAIPEALKIAEDVAEGVAAAHNAGVIHRDIKPANILLSQEGLAKLSDFGIAKDLDAVKSLTATGEGLGTLAYVSPEQATEAKTVDLRTDVYSLGATLFHMLAGQPPFTPANARVLLEILDQPPPPLTRFRSDCPPEVASFVERMIEKEPQRRPPTAALVARTLRELRKRYYPTYECLEPGEYDRHKTQSTDRGTIS